MVIYSFIVDNSLFENIIAYSKGVCNSISGTYCTLLLNNNINNINSYIVVFVDIVVQQYQH